jgi:CRISPR system Cascade subunit CasD
MKTYLALKLQGVMQAWGGHTFEDFRHTEVIPTRSGLLGLLAACLGIDRLDVAQQEALAASIKITVRADTGCTLATERMTDFHTVKDARKVDGKTNPYPVVSYREYLCDAVFTVLLEEQPGAVYSIADIARALRYPIYTPFLGRRSCPLSRPLYEAEIQAQDAWAALFMVEPCEGVVYSEDPLAVGGQPMTFRDVPMYRRKRQFSTRNVQVRVMVKEGSRVSE